MNKLSMLYPGRIFSWGNLRNLSFFFIFLFSTTISQAQVYTHYSVGSGFNADVIAENSPASTYTNSDVDGGSYVFKRNSYPSGGTGLPDNGLLNSATTSGLSFQLAAYNGNNTLRLTGTNSGTLVFINQEKAHQLAILATSGGGNSNFSGTITFSDNSTQQIYSQTVLDWYNNSNYVIWGIGRVRKSDGAIENPSQNPRIYQIIINIDAANQNKNVKQIAFTKAGSGVLNIMGVTSIRPGCNGTPSGGTVSVSPSSGVPGSAYTVSASGYTSAVGITYQWQSNTNNNGWVNVGSSSSTYANYSATAPALNSTVSWRLYVLCNNSGGTAYSNTATFTSAYCTPTGGNGNASDAITKFSLSNLNNNAQSPVITPPNGYTDYTALSPATLNVGQAYQASLTAKGNANHTANIWIDYNNNGVFESSEMVSTVNGDPLATNDGINLITSSFTVNNYPGIHRMRVQWVYNSNGNPNNLNPCNLISPWGETEDYRVNVVQVCPTAVSIVKTDQPNGANDCNLNYAQLTANGGEVVDKVAFFEDFSGQSGWSFSGPSTDLKMAYFATNQAGGTAPEGGIATNSANSYPGEWSFYPTVNGFDVSSFTNLSLSFKQKTDIFSPAFIDMNFYVEVSTNGTSYTPVWQKLDAEITNNFSETTTINLNSYAGSTTLYIRFRFQGNARGLNYWWLDDIRLNSNDKETTWTPTTGLYTDAALTIPYAGGHADVVYAAPDGTETYTATAFANGSCPQTAQVSVVKNGKTFIAANGVWSVDTNWSPPTAPDNQYCVRIPNGNHLTVDVNTAEAKNLTVEAGAKLTINSNQALNVTDFINNQATVNDFVIKSGGSLGQINDNAVNVGPITVERTFTFSAERKQYNYIISPVINQAIKPIYDNVPFVIYHKESANWFYNAYNGNYVPGKGFAIKEPLATGTTIGSTIDAIMKGIPQNGVVNYPLSFTLNPAPGVTEGYNLVGNPYPSNLDLVKLYTDNSTYIESTFKFWDNRGNTIYYQQGSTYQGDNYAEFNASNGTGNPAPKNLNHSTDKKNPDQYARPGTAFMIRAKSNANGQNLVFNNSQRMAANSTFSPEFFGKAMNLVPQKDRYWLNLVTPAGLAISTAIVYFDNGNNAYTEDDSDASSASDDLYSLIAEKQISIQGKAPFSVLDKVPLGMRFFELGTYTLTLEEKEGVFANGQNIYVYDKKLQKIHNLTASNYVFDSADGEYNSRFEIIYTPMTFQQDDSVLYAKGIKIEKKDGNIEVTSKNEKITKLEIFNLNGRSSFQKSGINSLEFKTPLNQLERQIIVVLVETESGEVVSKKLIW